MYYVNMYIYLLPQKKMIKMLTAKIYPVHPCRTHRYMEQKGSSWRSAEKKLDIRDFSCRSHLNQLIREDSKYVSLYLVMCSCMFRNKLYGVWGYGEEKASDVIVLSLLNYPNKISQVSLQEWLPRQRRYKTRMHRQKVYPTPSFLAFLNAQICSNLLPIS